MNEALASGLLSRAAYDKINHDNAIQLLGL